MSTPQFFLWATALAVGFVSAWRNPTALALVVAFAASQYGLSHEYYFFPDVFTIFVIFMKSTLPRAAVCSTADRFILISLPLSWFFYVEEADMLHFYWWWSLTIIAYAQFAAATWESLSPTIRRVADTVIRPPVHPGPFLIAYPAGGRFGQW